MITAEEFEKALSSGGVSVVEGSGIIENGLAEARVIVRKIPTDPESWTDGGVSALCVAALEQSDIAEKLGDFNKIGNNGLVWVEGAMFARFWVRLP